MEELGDKVGVHLSTIAKYERSHRRIPDDVVRDLAAALDVTAEQIDPQVQPRHSVRMVPRVGKIAAGNWREAIEEPLGWVPTTDGGPNSFALVPEGDSMNLVVRDGATIIIDPDQFELQDGKVYAVMNGEGETTFKRFRAAPPRLEPCSDNEAHKPIPLGREPFTVIGRMIAEIVTH